MININYKDTVFYKNKHGVLSQQEFEEYKSFIDEIINLNTDNISINNEKINNILLINKGKEQLIINSKIFNYKEDDKSIVLLINSGFNKLYGFIQDKELNNIYNFNIEKESDNNIIFNIEKNKKLGISKYHGKIEISKILDQETRDYISYTESIINLSIEGINVNTINLNPNLFTKEIDCFLHNTQYDSVVLDHKTQKLKDYKINNHIINKLRRLTSQEEYKIIKQKSQNLSLGNNHNYINEKFRTILETEELVSDSKSFQLVSDEELLKQVLSILNKKLIVNNQEEFNLVLNTMIEKVITYNQEKGLAINNIWDYLNLDTIQKLYDFIIEENISLNLNNKINLK